MNRINILDEGTINKIAAGEVIERPSSIVKELVENSIDASSTHVSIEIENGGKELIKVVDNGNGIDKDDIGKAFLRHATSKIKNAEDLNSILSLGFRGEALASIAAVSKIDLISKTENSIIASHARFEGGKNTLFEPQASNRGTSISVEDLFYNTPARRKFLKSTISETHSITDIVSKLAIGNPSISFSYKNNGKTILKTSGDGSYINAIRTVYGKDIATNLIPVEYKNDLFCIDGFLGNNNIYRGNKSLQHIYINGRYVKSSNITDIINDAYKAIIPINKFPVIFLRLQLPPQSMDINIHPSKLEVKFENESSLLSELSDYIRGTLLKTSLVGKYKTKNTSFYDTDKFSTFSNPTFSNREVEKNKKEIEKIIEDKNNSLSKKSNVYSEGNDSSIEVKENTIEDIYKNTNADFGFLESFKINEYKSDTSDIDMFDKTDNFISLKSVDSTLKNDAKCNYKSLTKDLNDQTSFIEDLYSNDRSDFYGMNMIGVAFNTYIIMQKNDKIIMIDQHAAHERVQFEKYMRLFRENKITIQHLLEPIVMELGINDMAIISRNIDKLLDFGFIVEIFGDRHIRITGVPNIFGYPEGKKFIIGFLDSIDKLESVYDEKYDEIAEIACKSAIKANDKINLDEAYSLIDDLKSCENPYTCPHGRPIMVEMKKYEIEKMFKRVMN